MTTSSRAYDHAKPGASEGLLHVQSTPQAEHQLPGARPLMYSVESPAAGSLSLEHVTEKRRAKTRRARWLVPRFGWWWEIVLLLLGTVCVALMIAILAVMDNKPLEYWRLPIRPNSLISVLSALARSFLLFPITEALGQLKWLYFEQARPLDQFHDFDEASRGPWGSLLFLGRMRLHALGASLGTLVTILLLDAQSVRAAVDRLCHATIRITQHYLVGIAHSCYN